MVIITTIIIITTIVIIMTNKNFSVGLMAFPLFSHFSVSRIKLILAESF